ncbi:MAG: Deoxyribodipyrimidine photo-lyase [Pseudomonadota bacterium]
MRLPPHLAERTWPAVLPSPRQGGAYVLYWMRTAVRAHENPALDVALLAAEALGLPAFVYHALDERYPYASDRHHAFILEGARDVAAQCAARGIGHAFHLARPGHRGPHLVTLAGNASLVVTEDFPWRPMEAWADEVQRRSGTPVWRVDTACVVPFRRVGRAYDRAFAFRDATKAAWEARAGRAWNDVAPTGPAFLPELPFTPVDLARADLPALIASCDIDHSVGPVAHTPGGTTAGLQRWSEFVAHGLGQYADARSSPLKPAGASRMSAYLHYGMVSPFRVAREAVAHRTEGAAKFLDELHVWREVPWSFCAYRPDHEDVSCLPAWARETLQRHAQDARPARFTWEQLARGRTGEPFWDALQTSLVVHGELHNQVRMTWGKALLQWTKDAPEALRLLIDLNHRYALDGRDPASYGGILWCLGLFDRPHLPEQPITGSVRARPLSVFSQRFDLAEYTRRVHRPARGVVERVGVVGAGVAGLAAARALADAGHDVTVFDKGRGAGGRLSTRRADVGTFDHGAPSFTAEDPRFRMYVDSWCAQGVVAEWTPRSTGPATRYVAVPGMNALVAHLGVDLSVRYGVEVKRLERGDSAWRLFDGAGQEVGTFTQLVLAAPAPQSVTLLRPVAPGLADEAARVAYAPCIAALVAFEAPLELGLDLVHGDGSGPLGQAVREGSKPGRPAGERWVLHASPEWSSAHVEEPPESSARTLLEDFLRRVQREGAAVAHFAGHRWRYSQASHLHPAPCLFDAQLQLGVCGDGFGVPGVEGAFLSGHALAGRLLALPAKADASPLRPSEAPPRAAQMTLL